MKKMMTNMKTLVALLMAGAAVTSCSSDNEMDSLKAPAGKTYTMTVQATKGGDATTRALADGGTTLTSTWSKDDVVEVWSEDGTSTKYGELTATAAGSSTTLTGTLTTAPTDQETLTLKYLSPNYSTHDGTLTGTDNSIDKKCDYATATVTATVDGDKVTTAAATFQHQQAVVKFTLVDKANTSTKLSPTALTINDGTSDIVTLTSIPDETYTTNGAGVLYVALPAVSSKPITLTATVGSDTYTLTTSSSKTFTIGNFYRVTAKMTKQAAVPTGALSGKFTINSSGDQVYFSNGNLQATTTNNGTSWTWAFAANQWSYIGNAAANNAINGNKSVSENGTVDLFGWSTADAENYLGIHKSNGDFCYSGNFVDWGSHADVIEGIGSGWRTLSKAEWLYLFNTRTVNGGTGSGKSYTLGQSVNSVLGVVLYPDGYTGELYTTAQSSNWATFESAGCVFLPAAGYRDFGAGVYDDGDDGYYWSSSDYSDIVAAAYYVFFTDDTEDLGEERFTDRYCGHSVRLVRPVQ